jgi:hypothetical protein
MSNENGTSVLAQSLQSINQKLHEIDKTLLVNTEHLAEHMRRTEIIETELRPVVKHVDQMRGAAKLLAILATIATIASIVLIVR